MQKHLRVHQGVIARLGRAILFAEQNESEVVNFTTSDSIS